MATGVTTVNAVAQPCFSKRAAVAVGVVALTVAVAMAILVIPQVSSQIGWRWPISAAVGGSCALIALTSIYCYSKARKAEQLLLEEKGNTLKNLINTDQILPGIHNDSYFKDTFDLLGEVLTTKEEREKEAEKPIEQQLPFIRIIWSKVFDPSTVDTLIQAAASSSSLPELITLSSSLPELITLDGYTFFKLVEGICSYSDKFVISSSEDEKLRLFVAALKQKFNEI